MTDARKMQHYKEPEKNEQIEPRIQPWKNPANNECGWHIPDVESNIGPCNDGTRCGINATIIVTLDGEEVSVCRTHQNDALDWLSEKTGIDVDDSYYR